jgi:hypothetical protein
MFRYLIFIILILPISAEVNLLYSESSFTDIYSDCNFSDSSPLKYACATQLNPPLFIRERNLAGNITYEMKNDDSFFYSSSDGNGIISILQAYGFNPMFAIHTTTLYYDKGPTYVVNFNSMEICQRNPIQTSSYRSVTAYINNQLNLRIDGNDVYSLGPFHCKNLKLGDDDQNLLAILHFNKDTYVSVFDITTIPVRLIDTINVENSSFEMCLSSKYLVMGYHYPSIHVYYPLKKRYLYSTSIIIESGFVLGGCKIKNNKLFISISSSHEDKIIAYSLDVLPFPVFIPFWESNLKFEGQYRNTISDFDVYMDEKETYISLSSWGGGNDYRNSDYPQFYIYSLPLKDPIFNYTTGGSMFFTEITKNEDKLYFLVGGQKGHANYPSKGGEMYLFSKK